MKVKSALLLANLLIGSTAFSQLAITSTPTHINDTAYQPTTTKTLIKTEQKEVLVFDRKQRVHSVTNSMGNKNAIAFTLPTSVVSDNKTTTVVAWAYWVSVNEESTQAWQQNVQALSTGANRTANTYSTPLGAYAKGVIPELTIPKTGEDVYYAVTNEANKDLFLAGKRFRLLDQGKGAAGYKKFTNKAQSQGTYFVCLSNDNTLIPVIVNIKVVAIVQTDYYETKTPTENK